MKRTYTDRMLLGLAVARPVEVLEQGVVLSAKEKSGIQLLCYAPSGNEPAMSGFVGPHGVDACVVGDENGSGGVAGCMEALRILNQRSAGAGTLLLVLNNPGDTLTCNLILKQAKLEEIPVAMVLLHDLPEELEDKTKAEAAVGYGGVGAVAVLKQAQQFKKEGLELKEMAEALQAYADKMLTIELEAEALAEIPVDSDELKPEAELLKVLEAGAVLLEQNEAEPKLQLLLSGNGRVLYGDLLCLAGKLAELLAEQGIACEIIEVGNLWAQEPYENIQVTLIKA